MGHSPAADSEGPVSCRDFGKFIGSHAVYYRLKQFMCISAASSHDLCMCMPVMLHS